LTKTLFDDHPVNNTPPDGCNIISSAKDAIMYEACEN
jgi:hypothetical protein